MNDFILNPLTYEIEVPYNKFHWDILFYGRNIFPRKELMLKMNLKHTLLRYDNSNCCFLYDELRYKASRSVACIVAVKQQDDIYPYEIAACGCPLLIVPEYIKIPIIEKIGVMVQWNKMEIPNDPFSDDDVLWEAFKKAEAMDRKEIRKSTLEYCKKGTIREEFPQLQYWEDDWDNNMDMTNRKRRSE